MRITVTGATGVLGRRLCADLLAGGHDVVGVRRAGVIVPGELHRVRWIDCDLADSSQPLPEMGVDAVVHLAQSRHYREFPEKASNVFDVNVASTARLIAYAPRCWSRLFCS